MVEFHDLVDTAGVARICADGSLVADVRAARVGIQVYSGREVDPNNQLGLRDKAEVKVYRPASEVFSVDSMASFAGAPLTIDHPTQPVTADNWKRLGVGEIHGDVVRDGSFVRVPIIVRDAAAVERVRTTHKQLSMGYRCTLDATPGKTPDGEMFDAVQRNIRINHIAAVPAGRGGPELKISDERAPHSQHKETPAMAGTIIVDGLPVSLADEVAVRAVLDKKDAAIKAGETALADAQAAASTLTGEKAALEKALADEKAKTEPAALDKLVADRSALVTKAKAVKADIVTDGKTDVEIRRAVVESALGDAAKDMDDAAIAGAFAVVAKDAKSATPKADPIARPASFADTASIAAAARAGRYAN